MKQAGRARGVRVRVGLTVTIIVAVIATGCVPPDPAPYSGTIAINAGSASTAQVAVTLSLSAPAAVTEMRLANGADPSGSAWRPYTTSVPWTLPSGAGTKSVSVQFRDSSGLMSTVASASIELEASGPPPELTGGAFHGVPPARVADSNSGSGGVTGPIAGGTSVDIPMLGVGGVPATGVGAVAFNLTVTNRGALSTSITASPAGAPLPAGSNLSVGPGDSMVTLVEVGIGSGGAVSVFNAAGSVDVAVDVVGWIASAPEPGTAGLFEPVSAARLLSTADGIGQAGPGQIGAGATLPVVVLGRGGVPATGVSALVVNITAVTPAAATELTAFADGSTRPAHASVIATAGRTTSNRAVVPVGPSGAISLFNSSAAVDLTVDVNGYYTDGSDPHQAGARFAAVTPLRLVDTLGGPPVTAGSPTNVRVAGRAGIPASDNQVPPTGAIVGVVVSQPSVAGALTVQPGGFDAAATPDVNFVAGGTASTVSVVGLGPAGDLSLSISAGTASVVVVVFGYFIGDVILEAGAHILSAASSAAIATVTPTSVAFHGIPPQLGDVLVGDTLNVGVTPTTPNGLMRLVTAVDTSGGNLALTTTAASLDQILGQGALHLTPDSPTLAGLRGAASSQGPSAQGAPALRVQGGVSGSMSWPFNLDLLPGGLATASGSVSVAVGLSRDIDAHMFPPSFDFSVAATAQATASAVVFAGIQDSVTPDCLELPELPATVPIPVPIGPVVVVVQLFLAVSICPSGEVKVGLSGGVTASASATVGVEHKDGHTTPIVAHDLTVQPVNPSGSIVEPMAAAKV